MRLSGDDPLDLRPRTWTDRELETMFAWIPWREPLSVHIVGDRSEGSDYDAWCCRYCIALKGLRAQDIVHGRTGEGVYRSRVEVLEHIMSEHGGREAAAR